MDGLRTMISLIVKDEPQYLIAKGPEWRVWNNGLIQRCERSEWVFVNESDSLTKRQKFVNLWTNFKVGDWTVMNWYTESCMYVSISYSYKFQQFLGFKDQREICSSCKDEFGSWTDQFLICENCNEILGFLQNDE